MTLIYELVIVGLVLSADSFSAALAMGTRPYTKKDAFQFALASGGAEGLFTFIGALTGSFIVSKLSAIDHWIAFSLLAAVALHMAFEGVKGLWSKEEHVEVLDFHSFKKILLVSFATSLDALSVGIGLGAAKKPLVPFALSIGIWAFLATLLGLHLGNRLSNKFGVYMHFIGSVVLGYLAYQALKI